MLSGSHVFLRYVDTKPNKKELRQCIFDGPYVMTIKTVPAKPTTAIEEAVPEHNVLETYKNTNPEKLDTCTTAKEMWIAIERLQQKLETISYHKLFDILKQYQNEVNDICAEKIARNANPLALIVATQQYPDDNYQAPKPHKIYATSSKQTPSTRSHATTRNKGK
ncbi:hypothetical protein Tco_0729022 [Tanacetum coccineum]|uniref:Uncharacterized protein n=1 Tax=Tanacetum coccineum TaxID=301880 RepID=A0ABQ4YQ46_9ASTR